MNPRSSFRRQLLLGFSFINEATKDQNSRATFKVPDFGEPEPGQLSRRLLMVVPLHGTLSSYQLTLALGVKVLHGAACQSPLWPLSPFPKCPGSWDAIPTGWAPWHSKQDAFFLRSRGNTLPASLP